MVKSDPRKGFHAQQLAALKRESEREYKIRLKFLARLYPQTYAKELEQAQ